MKTEANTAYNWVCIHKLFITSLVSFTKTRTEMKKSS